MMQVLQSHNVLDTVRRLLGEGLADEAMEFISRNRSGSQAVENARAVCLMRVGKPEQAMDVLRPMLFPHGSVVLDAETPIPFRTNYAAALLLSGNLVAGMEVLSAIHERSHPAVARLRDEVRKWKARLGPLERLLFAVGKTPSKPFAPSSPPGDV